MLEARGSSLSAAPNRGNDWRRSRLSPHATIDLGTRVRCLAEKSGLVAAFSRKPTTTCQIVVVMDTSMFAHTR